ITRVYHSPIIIIMYFFYNATAHTDIYTLSLHDALPISRTKSHQKLSRRRYFNETSKVFHVFPNWFRAFCRRHCVPDQKGDGRKRSEEHTSELQSLAYLVCRLLLEKKK